MATIRTIGKENKVYEIDSSENTLLIYLARDEKALISSLKDGDVVVLGPKNTNQTIFNKQRDLLIGEKKVHQII